MADAINRKQRNVRAADQARNERGVVLNAAVVVQKAAIQPLHQILELRNLMAAAADIENAELMQVEAISRSATVSSATSASRSRSADCRPRLASASSAVSLSSRRVSAMRRATSSDS